MVAFLLLFALEPGCVSAVTEPLLHKSSVPPIHLPASGSTSLVSSPLFQPPQCGVLALLHLVLALLGFSLSLFRIAEESSMGFGPSSQLRLFDFDTGETGGDAVLGASSMSMSN